MIAPHAHAVRTPLSRRELLVQCASGFGAVAFDALLRDARFARAAAGARDPQPHHAPRARNVIFLFMDGGPSQVDTFDPKERLQREDGKPFAMRMEPTQFNDNGSTLGSPWSFQRCGESGTPISELFPHLRRHADELAVVRSMVSGFSEHTNANYFLHTGIGLQGRPSMGAWIGYGLGSANRDLPGFVVLNGGLIPPGGIDCFGSGFLPARLQGTILNRGEQPIANIAPRESEPARQARKLRLLADLDRQGTARLGSSDAIESAIENHELAHRMQAAVPDLLELGAESHATRRMYGLDERYEPTRIFAQQCLLARRLVERGVRFVELTCPQVGADRWDQHSNLVEGHRNNARAVDQPIAALLTDLRRTGLLDETLVVWAGEFGRTPFAQGRNGRDHNPFGFSIWLAGAGIRGGTVHGATDEYGYKVVADKVTVHDLHATMLHLLGIDHTRLVHRFGGRDLRLTDVHGELIDAILA